VTSAAHADAPEAARSARSSTAIGGVYLVDRRPVAYTCVRRPRWPNEGAYESMGPWILMARESRS
jgi:hypothetical protein